MNKLKSIAVLVFILTSQGCALFIPAIPPIDDDMIEDLDSYILEIDWEIEYDDDDEEILITVQFSDDDEMQVDVETPDQTFGYVEIDNVAWVRTGADWGISDPGEFDIDDFEEYILTADVLGIDSWDTSDYDYVETKTINGVSTRHFKAEYDKDWSMDFEDVVDDIDEITIDIWVSDDPEYAGVLVKVIVEFEGEYNGEDANIEIVQEIDEINDTISIDTPIVLVAVTPEAAEVVEAVEAEDPNMIQEETPDVDLEEAVEPVIEYEPVKIAILAPLSGAVETFGESVKNGIMMAIDEWNGTGGVNGHDIEVVIYDSECSAEPAIEAIDSVINNENIEFVIGGVCAAVSIPVSEVVMANGAVQITPTSTHEAVTVAEDGVTKSGVFRACFVDAFQAEIAATFAVENLQAETAAVFINTDNGHVGKLSTHFIHTFTKLGGEVVVISEYSTTQDDFTDMLESAISAEVDIIFVPDYYTIVNSIAAQAQESGSDIPMMGGDGWDTPDLDTDVLEGSFFVNHFSVEVPEPDIVNFVEAHVALYGQQPDALSALGYEAATILLKAMDATGSVDPLVVAAYIEASEFSLITGDLRFDEQHNPVKTGFVFQIVDGEIVYAASVSPE